MRFLKMAVLWASALAALGVEVSIGAHGEVARQRGAAGQSEAVVRREKRGQPKTTGVVQVQPPDSSSSHDSERLGNALQQEAKVFQAPTGAFNGFSGGCFQDAKVVHCDAQETWFGGYKLFFQTPTKKGWGDRWDDSYAVVFFFHGTDMDGEAEDWGGVPYEAELGCYTEERTQAIKQLLEKGFAVVSPQAKTYRTSNGHGHTYWVINRWDYRFNWRSWEKSYDAQLMSKLFDKFKDMELHAVGYSSGAYHLSKVGNNPDFGPKLNSLSILSGGQLFESNVDVNHPPAQFLLGKGDEMIDVSQVKDYKKALDDSKVEARLVEKECAKPALKGDMGTGAHRWIPGARDLVLEWVQGHRRKRRGKPEPKAKAKWMAVMWRWWRR